MTKTNRFANQFLDQNLEHLPKNSRVHNWFDTSINELKVLLDYLFYRVSILSLTIPCVLLHMIPLAVNFFGFR